MAGKKPGTFNDRGKEYKPGISVYPRPRLYAIIKKIADDKMGGKMSPTIEKLCELAVRYGLQKEII